MFNRKPSTEINSLTTIRILWIWTFLQFPIGFILSLLGLLYVGPVHILMLTVVLALFTVLLKYLVKLKIACKYTSYLLIGSILIATGLSIYFYINDIAMQILWIFPSMISLLFFDRKLTLFAVIGSLMGLALLDVIQPIHYYPERFFDLFLTAILIILGTMAVLYFCALRIHSLFRSLNETDQQLKLSLQQLNQAYSSSRLVADELTKATISLASTTEYVNRNVAELAVQSNSASMSIERVVNETKHADDLVKTMLSNFDANIAQARHSTMNHLVATEKIHKTLQNIADSSNHTEQINQSLEVILEVIEDLKRHCYEVDKIIEFVDTIADQSLGRAVLAMDKEEVLNQYAQKIKDFCKTAQTIELTANKNVQTILDEISTIKLIVENEMRIALDVKRQLGIIQLIIDRNKRDIEKLDNQFEKQRKLVLELPKSIEIINTSIQEIAVSMEITAAFSEETSASMQDLAANAKSLGSSAEILKRSYQEQKTETDGWPNLS